MQQKHIKHITNYLANFTSYVDKLDIGEINNDPI